MRTVPFNFKNSVLTLLFFGICALGFSQLAYNKAPLAVAELSLESNAIDYGMVEQGSDGTRTISFTNTGDAPLIISNVKASCGCTVPTYSKAPVAPGEKGEITVQYNTKKIGKFTKTVTITSNAQKVTHQFKITGEVVAKS